MSRNIFFLYIHFYSSYVQWALYNCNLMWLTWLHPYRIVLAITVIFLSFRFFLLFIWSLFSLSYHNGMLTKVHAIIFIMSRTQTCYRFSFFCSYLFALCLLFWLNWLHMFFSKKENCTCLHLLETNRHKHV
jgi:hypothetical protein